MSSILFVVVNNQSKKSEMKLIISLYLDEVDTLDEVDIEDDVETELDVDTLEEIKEENQLTFQRWVHKSCFFEFSYLHN